MLRSTAEFSDCGLFRWNLCRQWDEGPAVCFVMLNPSIAGADVDDPTITRCIGFARAWGFGSLWVRNLSPFIATEPANLIRAMHRVDVSGGKRGTIELMASCNASLLVAAWGNPATKAMVGRFLEIAGDKDIWCLGTTKAGSPKHPLYLKGDTLPIPFKGCDGKDWRDCLVRGAH